MVSGSVGEIHGPEYQGIEVGVDRFTTPALGSLCLFPSQLRLSRSGPTGSQRGPKATRGL